MKKVLLTMGVMLMAAAPTMALEIQAEQFTGGWNAFWSNAMTWDMSVTASDTVSSWWSGELAAPGARSASQPIKYWYRSADNYAAGAPGDVTKCGVEWVSPTWSGMSPDTAVLAAYLTPGVVLAQQDKGYQPYRPDVYSWEDKDYFKTDARIAAVNANGASLSIKTYSYVDGAGNPWDDKSILSFLGETQVLLDAGDYVWQHAKMKLAKPLVTGQRVWFEISVVGGTSDTMLYIDEIRPVSDVYADETYADYVVPEPATLSLIALGGFGLLRRKRQ